MSDAKLNSTAEKLAIYSDFRYILYPIFPTLFSKLISIFIRLLHSCVPHRVIWGLLAFAVCCIVDFGPCLLVCPGSSVGRALCLDCRVSWVRVPPRAALFSFGEKSVVLGAVELFALHLCYLSLLLGKKVLSWVQLNCLLCTCVIYHLTMIHTFSMGAKTRARDSPKSERFASDMRVAHGWGS